VLDGLGGSEKNIFDLVRNLSPERFECHVIALRGGATLRRIQNAGIYAEDLGLRGLLAPRGLRKAIALLLFLRRHGIDILVTYHADADILGALVGSLARVPAIISSRRDIGYLITPSQLLAYTLVNRFVTRFIAVSEAVKNAISRSQGIPRTKITVIHNGADPDHITLPHNRYFLHELLHIPRSCTLVGTVASFRSVKNQELLVRSAAVVLRHHPNTAFVIIGDTHTDYYRVVRRLIRELHLEDRVFCLGNRSDVTSLLYSFDIFVLPSLHEGFSNAILEAMAVGLPVIASNSGGNPELLNDGSGILFDSNDSDALAAALLRLLNDPQIQHKMGRTARERVNRDFSLSSMITKHESLFLETVRCSQDR